MGTGPRQLSASLFILEEYKFERAAAADGQVSWTATSIMGIVTTSKKRTCPPGLADMPNSIWSHFQEHMDLKEWVRVAGTCKVSWNALLTDLMASIFDLDVPGWQYCLKRCTGAISISIYVEGSEDALSNALDIQQRGVHFKSVRELRFYGDLCGTGAFITLAEMS
ncbi:g4723 [Coccomyxa viridis]|uniref:G4723 protein n=1 Tax=Coccomyxa viridis TaxID=1274662 RepID=A0ABP1FR02_9CHLO